MKKGSGIRSLSVKLILNIGAIILIICLLMGVLTHLSATDAIEKNIDDSMQEMADEAAEKVNLKINDQIGNMETLVSNDRFYDVNLDENKNRIKEHITAFAKKDDILNVIVTDMSGTGYSMKSDNLNISSEDYFKKAVNGDKVVTNPIELSGYDDLVIIYSIPIRNDSDHIVGTISAIKDGYELSSFISDISYATSGYAYMIDGTGTTIAHATNNDSVKNKEKTIEQVKSDSELTELADLEKHMMNKEKGVGSYTYKGVTKYMAYAPVEGTDWSLALAAPKSEVMEGVNTLTTRIIFLSVAFFVIGIIIALFISKSITKPIKLAASYADTLSEGDFSADVPEKFLKKKDEIGVLAEAFKKLIYNINELMSNIKTASEQVATGAKQISDSSMQLSQGATEQASSIEELTASIEEISSQTKLNAENAGNANNIAVEAQKNANVGNDQMKNMLKAMDDINTSSSSISKIIKVIDDIAFQTNILALNAAVEAARAGQAGKGFAVVAEEVRNLAAKSANAAKETTELIEGSIRKVNDGTKIASETAEQLKKIVVEVSKVAELVNSISVASNEQASGIAQVNQGIMQVSQVVQENSSTSEESAAASEELSGQAVLLEEQISMFKLRDDKNGKKVVKQEIIPAKSSVPEPLKAASDKSNIKISLSDNEFGKY